MEDELLKTLGDSFVNTAPDIFKLLLPIMLAIGGLHLSIWVLEQAFDKFMGISEGKRIEAANAAIVKKDKRRVEREQENMEKAINRDMFFQDLALRGADEREKWAERKREMFFENMTLRSSKMKQYGDNVIRRRRSNYEYDESEVQYD